MGGLFGGSSMPAPQAPPPVPTANAAAIAASKQQESELLARQRGGRSSTVLNGYQGLGSAGTVSSTSSLLGGG